MSENHGILYMPDGSFQRANYMGPGTDVIGRLQRGDEGKTYMDNVAQLHDIEYMLATGTSTSPEEVKRKSRRADERMVEYGKRGYRTSADNWFNVTQGAGLIKAKMILEDMGLLDQQKFVGKHTAKYIEGAQDRDAVEAELLHTKRRKIFLGGPLRDLNFYRDEYGEERLFEDLLMANEVEFSDEPVYLDLPNWSPWTDEYPDEITTDGANPISV